MLDIRFKEAIENGTMCAFVSKDKMFNIGEQIFFCLWLTDAGEDPKVRIANGLEMLDIPGLHNNQFADAECVGVVKGKLEFYCSDNKPINDSLLFNSGNIPIGISECDLGIADGCCGIHEGFNYYQSLLGDTLEGYLHIFKLVKDGE